MHPVKPFPDTIDGIYRYPIMYSECPVWEAASPNATYFFFGKFGLTLRLAPRLRTMALLIKDVLSACSPAKVSYVVIDLIAVVVSYLVAATRWVPYKSYCYKPMHTKAYLNTPLRQAYPEVPCPLQIQFAYIRPRTLPATGSGNSPVVTYGVTRSFWYRFPNLLCETI